MTFKMRLLWCVVFTLFGAVLGYAIGETYSTKALTTKGLIAAIIVVLFMNLLFCPPYALLELFCFFIGEVVAYLVVTMPQGFNFASVLLLASACAGLAANAIISRRRRILPSS